MCQILGGIYFGFLFRVIAWDLSDFTCSVLTSVCSGGGLVSLVFPGIWWFGWFMLICWNCRFRCCVWVG